MAGKPGRSGGPRRNSGRPTKRDEHYQTTMRDLIRDVVTPDDWRRVLAVRLSFALAGNGDAFRDLEKWVMGKVPDQLNLGGPDGGPLEIAHANLDEAIAGRLATLAAGGQGPPALAAPGPPDPDHPAG